MVSYLKEKLTDHCTRQQPSARPGKESSSWKWSWKQERAGLLLLFKAKETTPKWAGILKAIG